jgi:hypothetical protein
VVRLQLLQIRSCFRWVFGGVLLIFSQYCQYMYS